MTDYSTYLLYGFHYNLNQKVHCTGTTPYTTITINKVAVTNNKVTATISSFRFYQRSHAVSIKQRGPLLSICQESNCPISPRKGTLGEHTEPVIHT